MVIQPPLTAVFIRRTKVFTPLFYLSSDRDQTWVPCSRVHPAHSPGRGGPEVCRVG